MKRLSFVFVMVFCIGFTKIVVAEPFVIFNSGDTVSTAPYKSVIFGGQRVSKLHAWFNKKMPGVVIDETDKKMNELFPVSTERLSSHYIVQNIYAATMPSPACVLGADDLSLRWVRRNVAMLKRIKASCFLVSASNMTNARLIANALDGVSINIANGDKLSALFDFNYYPVLIKNE